MTKVKMYHLTGVEFKKGDQLVPMEHGYVYQDNSIALETILERYRPEDKLSREDSVFLSDAIPTKGFCFGADADDYLVVCDLPISVLSQKSDFNWLAAIDQGFDDVSILEEHYSVWFSVLVPFFLQSRDRTFRIYVVT